jgi:hypothetical protein
VKLGTISKVIIYTSIESSVNGPYSGLSTNLVHNLVFEDLKVLWIRYTIAVDLLIDNLLEYEEIENLDFQYNNTILGRSPCHQKRIS